MHLPLRRNFQKHALLLDTTTSHNRFVPTENINWLRPCCQVYMSMQWAQNSVFH